MVLWTDTPGTMDLFTLAIEPFPFFSNSKCSRIGPLLKLPSEYLTGSGSSKSLVDSMWQNAILYSCQEKDLAQRYNGGRNY